MIDSIPVQVTSRTGLLNAGATFRFIEHLHVQWRPRLPLNNALLTEMKDIPMKYTLLTLVFLSLCLCSNCGGTGHNPIDPLPEGVFEIIETDSGMVQTQNMSSLVQRMEALNIPGLSVAVIDDFKILTAFAIGKKDSVNNAEKNTLFEAASVSKYVTAIIVHHYVEKGLLDLDTDIDHYLKTWKMPPNDLTKNNPITLRLLLTHQSGLPSTNFDYDKEMGRPSLRQVLAAEPSAINKPAVPEFAPGSSWSYSNIGYALIQLILEDVLGKPFESIANEVIFSPLEMTSSTFEYPLPDKFKDREAKPFNSAGEEKAEELDSPAKAQGGLMCPPEDLARLTVEILKAYQGKSKIFSKDIACKLTTKELQLPFKLYGQSSYMGPGVLLMGENESLAFIHNGYNSPGSVCIVIGFPETGQGAVIASNSANGEHLYLEVIATLADRYNWPSGQFFKNQIGN